MTKKLTVIAGLIYRNFQGLMSLSKLFFNVAFLLVWRVSYCQEVDSIKNFTTSNNFAKITFSSTYLNARGAHTGFSLGNISPVIGFINLKKKLVHEVELSKFGFNKGKGYQSPYGFNTETKWWRTEIGLDYRCNYFFSVDKRKTLRPFIGLSSFLGFSMAKYNYTGINAKYIFRSLTYKSSLNVGIQWHLKRYFFDITFPLDFFQGNFTKGKYKNYSHPKNPTYDPSHESSLAYFHLLQELWIVKFGFGIKL